jgi:hypothetical protein
MFVDTLIYFGVQFSLEIPINGFIIRNGIIKLSDAPPFTMKKTNTVAEKGN